MLEPETIKFCYSTHPQQTVARIDYTYDAQPNSATSIANILPEGCRLAGIKRGVTLHMLKNTVETHLPDQGGIWVISKRIIVVLLKLILVWNELFII